MDYIISTRRPDIRLPIDITSTYEFTKWISGPSAGIWFLLHGRAVRREFKHNVFGTYIYDKYYKNGMVVSYLTQKDIKEILEVASKGFISTMLKNLCEQGIIKEHEDKLNGSRIKLYQTAKVLDVENQLESVFLITILRRQIAKNKLAKFE